MCVERKHSISSSLIESSSNSITSREHKDALSAIQKYEGVAIALFDLVGFSNWCASREPEQVVEFMSRFNEYLTETVSRYDTLTKIELVGDSCLIAAGMDLCLFDDTNSVCGEILHVQELFDCCMSIMEYDIGKHVFDGENINVRAGMAIGDVCGTFMSSPSKFQLFGSVINIASRLESSSKPGVLHVCEKVLMIIEEHGPLRQLDLHFGKLRKSKFKGVGEVASSLITLSHTDKVLVLCDGLCEDSFSITDKQSEKLWEFVSLHKRGDLLYQGLYEQSVFLFTKRGTVPLEFYTHLKKFRSWEKQYRHSYQSIETMCSNDSHTRGKLQGMLEDSSSDIIQHVSLFRKSTVQKILNYLMKKWVGRSP